MKTRFDRTRTTYLATRGVAEYRAKTPQVVRPPDSVLELGCECGTTTALLARQGYRSQALGTHFTKIDRDYHSLLDTIALLNSYAAVLRPEVIVVKSGALKDFARNCAAWSPDERS